MGSSKATQLSSSDQTLSQGISARKLLKQLLSITAVSLLLSDLVILLRGNLTSDALTMSLFYGLFLAVGAGLLRANRVLWASHLFTAVSWLSLTLYLTMFGVNATPTLGAYLVLILVAALLLRGPATIFYASLSFSAGLVLAFATGTGRVPLLPPSPGFIVDIGRSFPRLFIILALLGIAFYALHFTLATLRFNEHDLDQIWQTLGQRTADLATINEQLRHEIYERQQTEKALEQQRAFLRQIIDTIPHLVFVKDQANQFLIINKALAEIYRATPQEIEGRRGREFNPNSEEMSKLEEGDQAVLASGQEMFWPELPFTLLDGKKHWLQVVKRPLYDKVNDVTHVLGIATDITLIKQTTEALREKEENFRTLVEASFEGIVICIDQIIQQANLNFATMFGYTAVSDVLGKNADAFFAPESTAAALQFMQKEQKATIEAVGIRQNKSTFPIEVVSHPINFQGKLADISGYRDISSRKKMEEAEQQAQKLESLTIMAGGLAHDFNNLLVAMMGQIALAKARLEPDHPSHNNLEKAIQATETTALLTRQLLAYTGQGHFEVKLIHLNHLISQNLQLFQDALPPNIAFQTNLHEPLPHIKADSAQIQQIIMNLLLNAAAAIGTKEGIITITTAPYQLTASRIEQWRPINEDVSEGRYVLLEVSDTGHGMDETILKRIFDPFFSTKGTGRGLGLAAVLGIVRGHKGSVRAKSKPGLGTSLQFLFPYDEFTHTGEDKAISTPQPSQGTVLIIDDEKQVREAISDILELKEIPTLLAASGQAGVELFAVHYDKISLVILDLSMPGMSGIETFEALLKLDPTAKVILSSGFTEGDVLNRLAGIRPAGFLQKPYRLETVLATVEKHL